MLLSYDMYHMITKEEVVNILIVFAHPQRQSLNGSLLDQTIKSLNEGEIKPDIQVVDLYRESFDPRLQFGSDKKRRDMHKDPEMENYRQMVLWAKKIIFIYPIWWGRPPAILLGFFDRLMASEFAYRHSKKDLLATGLLRGREVVCLSTMKAPGWFAELWLGGAHKILMRRAIFHFVGIHKVKFLQLAEMEDPSGRKQNRALDKVGRYFRKAG